MLRHLDRPRAQGVDLSLRRGETVRSKLPLFPQPLLVLQVRQYHLRGGRGLIQCATCKLSQSLFLLPASLSYGHQGSAGDEGGNANDEKSVCEAQPLRVAHLLARSLSAFLPTKTLHVFRRTHFCIKEGNAYIAYISASTP